MKMASQQDVQVSNDNSNDKSFEVARCSEVDPVNHQPLRISNDIFLNWSEKNNDAYVETDTVQVQGGGGITATNQVASKRIPLAKISISQNKISFETLGGYIWIKNAYWELDRKNGNLDVTDANDRAELSGASTLLGAYHCIKGRGGL
jgi:hypothetical protein